METPSAPRGTTLHRLQLLVPQVEALLEKPVNIVQFHQDCGTLFGRLSYVTQVLHKLQYGDAVEFDPDIISIQTVVNELTKLRFLEQVVSKEEFEKTFPEQRDVTYDLLEWLFENKETVALRAYIAKYVDPMEVPEEPSTDPTVQGLLDTNKELVELFWETYQKYSASQKKVYAAYEINNDLRAMYRDIDILEKRTAIQKHRLLGVPNVDSLLFQGIVFQEFSKERNRIHREIAKATEHIVRMERAIADIRRLVKNRPQQAEELIPTGKAVLERNKALLQTGMPRERDQFATARRALERAVNERADPEDLAKRIRKLNSEIYDMRVRREKVDEYTADMVLPFRKTATGVTNRKERLTDRVNQVRNRYLYLKDKVKTKENRLRCAIGGEVYHGEKLKRYISSLRDKSVDYKAKRSRIQYWVAETNLLTRTSDILRNIDPSLADTPGPSRPIDDDDSKSSLSKSTFEAKITKRKLLPELESLKSSAIRAQRNLKEIREEMEEVASTHETLEEKLTRATKSVGEDITRLSDKKQAKLDRIQKLERDWKANRLDLDGLDQIFNHLVDEVLEGKSFSKESYASRLEGDYNKLREECEDLEKTIADTEEDRKRLYRKMEIFTELKVLLDSDRN